MQMSVIRANENQEKLVLVGRQGAHHTHTHTHIRWRGGAHNVEEGIKTTTHSSFLDEIIGRKELLYLGRRHSLPSFFSLILSLQCFVYIISFFVHLCTHQMDAGLQETELCGLSHSCSFYSLPPAPPPPFHKWNGREEFFIFYLVKLKEVHRRDNVHRLVVPRYVDDAVFGVVPQADEPS